MKETFILIEYTEFFVNMSFESMLSM